MIFDIVNCHLHLRPQKLLKKHWINFYFHFQIYTSKNNEKWIGSVQGARLQPFFSNSDASSFIVRRPIRDGASGHFLHVVQVNLTPGSIVPITLGTFTVTKILGWDMVRHWMWVVTFYASCKTTKVKLCILQARHHKHKHLFAMLKWAGNVHFCVSQTLIPTVYIFHLVHKTQSSLSFNIIFKTIQMMTP